MILDALRRAGRRTIGLGRADDRYFTFCAGFGLDAAVVRPGGAGPAAGTGIHPGALLRVRPLSQYFLGATAGIRRSRLERPGEPAEAELATVIIQNTAPWTYLGDRAINP